MIYDQFGFIDNDLMELCDMVKCSSIEDIIRKKLFGIVKYEGNSFRKKLIEDCIDTKKKYTLYIDAEKSYDADPKVIIDAGANIGTTAIFFAK